MQIIKTKHGQWAGDLAIDIAGSIDVLADFCIANNLSVTQLIETNSPMQVVPVSNRQIVEYFRRNGLIPASSDFQTDKIEGVGIGFMTINKDFIVSFPKR